MNWNVGYIAKKRADLTPDKTAFFYEDTPITYEKLNHGVNRFSHFLLEKGLKKGDRISVLLYNCPEFLEIYLAAAKLGLIFVPLNFRLVGPELEYQLNNAGSRLLVFHDSLIENFAEIRSETDIEKDKFIFLKSGVPDAPVCPDWALDYGETLKDSSTDEPTIGKPVMLDDPLAIVYTSGVTGNPKGATFSHQQTYSKSYQVILYTDMRSTDIFLAQLPLFHSGGLFILATPVLSCGAAFVMRKNFDGALFAQDIQRYKADIVFGLTTQWRFALQSGELDKIDTSHVRVTVGAGERTPLTLFEDMAQRGLPLQAGFGQTENSFMMFMPKEDVQSKMGSIGKPGFFSEIWIADAQGGSLPPGKIGEIVAKGPIVMSGYWNMPQTTAETIVDGVLHTGDLGYRDEDGFFYIVDRVKDMYRSGGENVYPAEIEKVLADHPKIADVSIIGVSDEKWGETGKALIVLRKGEKFTEEEMREFLTGKVAKYKFPKHMEFIKSMPMTGSGKIKKSELKKKYGGVKLS